MPTTVSKFYGVLTKNGRLQAFKVVPDLLVHAVYTKFLPNFGTPEIHRPLCQSFMAFWLKIDQLQASKVLPDLLLHAVYTIFLPIYCTPEIYQPMCQFYGVLAKNGQVTGLQCDAWFAGACGLQGGK